jgi:hypothetical protein
MSVSRPHTAGQAAASRSGLRSVAVMAIARGPFTRDSKGEHPEAVPMSVIQPGPLFPANNVRFLPEA